MNLSPDGDALRFIESHAMRILIGWQEDDYAQVYILDRATGLWSRDPVLFMALYYERMQAFGREFQAAELDQDIDGFTALEKRRARQMIIARKSSGHAEECRRAIGALVRQLIDKGEQTESLWYRQLTLCEADEMDSDMSCIAAPNGVIDLKTGRLMLPHDAKHRHMTTTNMIPDPYEPEAKHSDVARLTKHMPVMHAAYILSEFGYSLHGRPTRRFLMLICRPGGGKSTLADALHYSLGPLVSRAPGQSLARSQVARNDADPNAASFVSPIRIAIVEEIERIKISTDTLKERTGDAAVIKYRKLYENPQDRRPTATPLLLGNQPPQHLGLTDPGVAQRCKPLPFLPIETDTTDLHLRYAWSPHDKAPREASEAVTRRQALVAELVRAAVTYPAGDPPAQPTEVLEIIESWEDDELGEVGRWLIDGFEADDQSYVVIDELWDKMVTKFKADKDGKVQGWQRSTFAKRIKSILPDLPPATRYRQYGRKRGWAGWRFDEPYTDEPAYVDAEGREMFV